MKFNKKVKSAATTNLAGGKAYKQTDKLEFVSILLTSFLKDQFYRSEDETVQRLKELVGGLKDKKFAAKAAIYARTKYGMRSVSHLVAAELFAPNVLSNQPWAKNFIKKVIYRPDDALEIMGYFTKNVMVDALPNQLRKGLALFLQDLNEYKLAKYKGEGKDFSMVDLVNLVHPKATDAITKLMKGTLKPANTWETKLTQAGQEAETEEDLAEKKDKAWKDLILEKKLGYFALLRNLRNIAEQSPEVMPQALEMLTDEALIKKSLVMPFRFLTALAEIEKLPDARKIVTAINKAIEISLSNVPTFTGRTLVVLDTSGSMMGKPAEIGSLFSAVLYKTNDADFMNFSDDAEYHTLNASDSVMTIAKGMNFRSGGTNFHAIFQKAARPYDRIIILSDMQGWMESSTWHPGYNISDGGAPTSSFEAYKKKFKCEPKIYSFDLQGYGTLQFPQPNVFALAGFSEKVFDTMKLLEADKNALINEIETIEL